MKQAINRHSHSWLRNILMIFAVALTEGCDAHLKFGILEGNMFKIHLYQHINLLKSNICIYVFYKQT